MKILELRTFPGRNVYTLRPAVRALIDLQDLACKESREYPGFNQRLLSVLPGLRLHGCASGEENGFIQRLQEGTYFGHVLEHVILELQTLLGIEGRYGKTRSTDQVGVYEVVFESRAQGISDLLVSTGIDIIQACLQGESFPLEPALNKLRQRLAATELGPSTQALVQAARRRGISVTRIGSGSLLQLGTGRYAKRVQATLTSETSCIAADIAGDKSLTKLVLGEAGIPVPRGKVVHSADEALSAWQEMNCPVVIKPCDGNQGKGVSLNLNSAREIRQAFEIARRFSAEILVEEYVEGRHYRFLVVNGQMVAAAERIPAHVVGNGQDCIQALIDAVNADPDRGMEHEKPLTRIVVDDMVQAVLARQNLTLDDVPERGAFVRLRDNANLSTGGTAVDVTDQVHPELAQTMVRAVRAVGLDVAGVDLVTDDVSRPLADRQGAVIEVNAAPGIRMHHYPSQGTSRDVADRIIGGLYPPGSRSEIPLVAITGTNGKTTTSRLVAHTLRQIYPVIGLTSTEGIFLNDKCIVSGDTTGAWSARVVLSDPTVDAAVLELARGGLIRGGLAYEQSDVAVLTNISEDHLGQDNLDSLDDLVWVKSLVLEAVRPDGYTVLNADDEQSLRALERVRSRVIYFSLRGDNRHIQHHLALGERAVILRDGWLCLAEGKACQPLLAVGDIPIAFGGHAQYNVANACAAVAALWGMGVPTDLIASGLRSFRPEVHNPGRQTLLQVAQRMVMVDYAHNVAGLRGLVALSRSLTRGRLIGVIAAPGDRRSNSIYRLGQVAGQGFDLVYIKEDQQLRGRAPGEVAEILRQGAAAAGLPATSIGVHLQEADALRAALHEAQPGDLVVVLYEDLELTLSILNALDGDAALQKSRKSVVAGVADL